MQVRQGRRSGQLHAARAEAAPVSHSFMCALSRPCSKAAPVSHSFMCALSRPCSKVWRSHRRPFNLLKLVYYSFLSPFLSPFLPPSSFYKVWCPHRRPSYHGHRQRRLAQSCHDHRRALPGPTLPRRSVGARLSRTAADRLSDSADAGDASCRHSVRCNRVCTIII